MGKLRLREADVACLRTYASYGGLRVRNQVPGHKSNMIWGHHSGFSTSAQGGEDQRVFKEAYNFNFKALQLVPPWMTYKYWILLKLQTPDVYSFQLIVHGKIGLSGILFLPFPIGGSVWSMCVPVFWKFFLTEAERFLTNNFNILCVCVAGSNNPASLQGHCED